jgi:hypothetical protein
MSDVEARADPGAPLLLRSLGLRPAALVVTGIALSAVLLVIYQVLPAAGPSRFDAGRFFALMLGYYVALVPLAVRAATRALDQLPALPPGRREFFRRELARIHPAWLLSLATFNVGMHLGILAMTDQPLDPLAGFGMSPARNAFTLVLSWVHILVLSFAVASLTRQSFVLLRLGRELPEIDLLDSAPLAPIVRVAQAITLAFALAGAAALLLHIDWAGDRSLAPQMLLGMPVWLVIGTGLFLFPLWGLHQRLRDERTAELGRVHAALRGQPGAFVDSAIVRPGETLTTVELLSYRSQIESLGTWPFRASALVRLALYLGIPLAGWIAGALVERVLDTLLD